MSNTLPELDGQTPSPVGTSGYAGTGQWSVQLGELQLAGSPAAHLYVNFVDPYGNIAGQMNGLATDRTSGRAVAFGDTDDQLAVHFSGEDLWQGQDRIVHEPRPIGDQAAFTQLMTELGARGQEINAQNVAYSPHFMLTGQATRNSNTVVGELGEVIERFAPGFEADIRRSYFWAPGAGRELEGTPSADAPLAPSVRGPDGQGGIGLIGNPAPQAPEAYSEEGMELIDDALAARRRRQERLRQNTGPRR